MLTDDDVRHVARLVRLGVDGAEVERLRGELAGILGHVSTISAIDLGGVPPTSHPLDVVNGLAPDVEQPSLPRAEALANAPDPADDGFRVPPIGA